jgi:hypothetical protein
MKTFAAFVVAGGLLLSAQATFAQRDAGSKMDGEAYEIDVPAPPSTDNWSFEAQEAPAAPTETVKTGAVENEGSADRQQNQDANNNVEPKN